MKDYACQDYTVRAISNKSITLKHETGDTLSVRVNYVGKYGVVDKVHYNSTDNKFQQDSDSGKYKQFTVIDSYIDKIIILSNDGQQLPLHLDNNLYPERKGGYILKFKVGDLVRYNTSTHKLKKGVIRTYDWQNYKIKEVTADRIILTDTNNMELILKNTYRTKFTAGDSVKYDRVNNLLKKVR